ncbi:glycosyltransferase [uncultured Thiohalocapsa sp.]|uniref:glycosyltransferase family 2 protein n=1 Tax=uncultured Thiohalocapsa sp. TaxID=768990 RepID=UPI0025E68C5F|nr:glycosyltransferase [uncultured Thiohalocapsa sp.]
MPLVSVVVPNYNHAPFLKQRLDSILAQTFQDYELLILDDASTDGSLEIIREFQSYHPDTRVLINDCNSGSPFRQWDYGVREAHGRYVWIAESDDVADPELLASLVAVMRQDDRIGLAYSGMRYIDEQGNVLARTRLQRPGSSTPADRTTSGMHEISTQLCARNTISTVSGALLRRSRYLKSGLADVGMRYCGDWFLYVRMLLDSDVGYVDKHMSSMRIHAGSTLHRHYHDPRYLEEIAYIFQFLKRSGILSRRSRAKMRHFMARHVCQSLMHSCMPSRRSIRMMRSTEPLFMLHLPYAFTDLVVSELVGRLRERIGGRQQ